MMKFILGPLILALPLTCNIAVAMPQHCDVWEYARLKDSTQEELTAHVCESRKAAAANRDEKYTLLGNVGGNSLYEADLVAKAEALCRDQVKVTKSVFLQKFGKAVRDEDCATPGAK